MSFTEALHLSRAEVAGKQSEDERGEAVLWNLSLSTRWAEFGGRISFPGTFCQECQEPLHALQRRLFARRATYHPQLSARQVSFLLCGPGPTHFLINPGAGKQEFLWTLALLDMVI